MGSQQRLQYIDALTHYSITQEICIYVNKLMTGQDHLSGWRAIAYFVLCIIITYPMVWFINKNVHIL